MKYKKFDSFGVEIYKDHEYIVTIYFSGIKDAFEFAKDIGAQGKTYRFITANEQGEVIDVID